MLSARHTLPPLAGLLAAICLASPGFAADKPVHFFVLTGQSNMAGMDPKAGFLPEAERLFPDAEIAFIKVARGGQPIRQWLAEWNEIAEKHDLKARIESTKFYQPILDQYAKHVEAHGKPATVTFCWMQGERDGKENLGAAYADALNQLIANLRRDLQAPEMNVVVGRICDHIKEDHKSWTAVREAQVAVAKSDPRGSWVDCDDLNDKPGKDGKLRDDLHYTKDGYALLGRRYARQAKALIDGKEPADDGRPE